VERDENDADEFSASYPSLNGAHEDVM